MEQHKRLLLHLTKANVITLPAGAAEGLSERLSTFKDNGAVVERDEDDLRQVDDAEVWYRALNNEFVRIARAYRTAHPW